MIPDNLLSKLPSCHFFSRLYFVTSHLLVQQYNSSYKKLPTYCPDNSPSCLVLCKLATKTPHSLRTRSICIHEHSWLVTF